MLRGKSAIRRTIRIIDILKLDRTPLEEAFPSTEPTQKNITINPRGLTEFTPLEEAFPSTEAKSKNITINPRPPPAKKAPAKKAPAKRREKGKDTPYGSGYYMINDNYDKLKAVF
jgi:hypothetical protein